MNICFIGIDYHSKKSGGGIASYIDTVAKELIKRGHQVIVISKSTSNSPQFIEEGNFKVFLVPLGNIHYYFYKIPFLGVRCAELIRQFEWSFQLWQALRTILSKYPIDIIESQELGNLFMMSSFKNIPFIIKSHASTYNTRVHSGKRIYLGIWMSRLLERFCLRRAAFVVTPTKEHAKEISMETGIALDKIKVIANPISNYFIEQSSKSATPFFKKPIILYTGRIEYRKGVLILLRSVSYVIKENNNVEFFLAGGYHPSLRPRAIKKLLDRERISKHVTMAGHVEWPKLSELYRKSTIYVMPSYYETFSISSVEAMLFGLPVVASSAGGLSEIIQDGKTGLLIPPGDPEALAEAINRLLADSDLRKRLGEEGRRYALENFKPDNVVEEMLNLYHFAMDKEA